MATEKTKKTAKKDSTKSAPSKGKPASRGAEKDQEPRAGGLSTDGPPAPAGAPGAAGVSPVTGEQPMAAWPPHAEPATTHQYLLTAPGEEGDPGLDLAGALPYANFTESREGPNGITWLVTVSEADSENFLAQAEAAGHTVQKLHPDGGGFDHVLGDKDGGWVMPDDRPREPAQQGA